MAVDDFVNSANEEITSHNLDGIFMLVPVSKRAKIAGFKYFSELYSPKVLCLNLPIVKCDTTDDEDDDEYPRVQKISNLNSENQLKDLNDNTESPLALLNQEIERSERISSLGNISLDISQEEIFSNDIPIDPVSNESISEMDISCGPEVHPIKLEPNVQIEDNESNAKENKRMPTDSEKEWIYSNIVKCYMSKPQKNGKCRVFKCSICKKKSPTKPGAYQHVLNVHLRKILKKNLIRMSFMDSNLSPDEMKFIKENSFAFKNLNHKRGRCKICQIPFKRYESCKIHIITHHLKKSLTEFNYDAMKKKIITLGKVENDFQCIICKDNENLIIFKSQKILMKHLKLHKKEDLKSYANQDENREITPPDDATFNHPIMQIKSEAFYC